MSYIDEKRSERIEQKIDGIVSRLSEIDKTLAAQHVILDEHIRRTSILEQQLAPIKLHVDGIKSVTKFLMIMTGLAGAVAGFKVWIK
jgi:hypothetical protein